MSWKDKAIVLYRRFGAPTKFAAKMILGAVVPGGPAVVQLVGEVLDCVYETAKDNLAVIERRLPTATPADWQRVEEILDLLAGDVAPLMEQVARLDGLEEQAAETIRLALATDAHCRDALRRLDHLARRFDNLEEQNKKLLQGQGYAANMLAEMLPLMRRMAGVADYIDDLCREGISAADFRSCLREFQDAARAFREGHIGWGRVFKASRGDDVRALKVMHPELARDWQFVERFKKEIETLIKLPRHANLVRIEGFGFCLARQTWYLTMEHVDGPTLEQYLANKGPLSEAHVRKVFPDAIDGLAKAHSAGIVHRDIKPGNLIFRKSDQRLVFVDFGLAVGAEDLGQTKVGGLSVQFAAPEQHYGKRATQASDVFSLCALIHYALHYDKPDQRTPDGFSPDLADPTLRDAPAGGMKYNVGQRLRDAGQLSQALVPVAKVAEGAKPSAPTARPLTDYTRGKIGDIIEVPLTSSLKMKFACVPPGTSWLGGGGGKSGQQQFTLDKGLWCGVYPVTQAEWKAVMGDDPSRFKDNPRHPVESVSWDRVQKKFLKALNTKLRDSRLLFRLPTEQEWEYICRGGPISQDQSKYHFYFAKLKADLTPVPTNDLSSSQANFDGNYPAGSAPKGQYREAASEVNLFLPNPLGIYDLHGNVWEWTTTRKGSNRVIRGGSWNNNGENCTASNRNWNEPANANNNVGFRLLAAPLASRKQTQRNRPPSCSSTAQRKTKVFENRPALVASANAPGIRPSFRRQRKTLLPITSAAGGGFVVPTLRMSLRAFGRNEGLRAAGFMPAGINPAARSFFPDALRMLGAGRASRMLRAAISSSTRRGKSRICSEDGNTCTIGWPLSEDGEGACCSGVSLGANRCHSMRWRCGGVAKWRTDFSCDALLTPFQANLFARIVSFPS